MLKILEHWGLDSVLDEQNQGLIDQSSWRIKIITTSTAKYVLKKKDLSDRHILFVEFDFLMYLNMKNIPVSLLIKTIDGESYYQDNNVAYCLYQYSEGTHVSIKHISDYSHYVFEIAQTLGKMHNALQKAPFFEEVKTQFIDQVSNLKDIKNRIEVLLHENQGIYDITQIVKHIGRLENEFISIENKLPKQLIHRDYHSENIIFNGYTIAAIIDFDLTYFEIKVFDVCYFCSSILGELFNEISNDEEKWFDILKIFIESYKQTNTINEDEKRIFHNILSQIQILCMIYYIKIGKHKEAKKTEQIFFWISKMKEKITGILQ